MTTIEGILEKHDKVRLEALNLIVSENRMSPRALAPLSSDIQSRYAASFYAGTAPAQEIVGAVAKEAAESSGPSTPTRPVPSCRWPGTTCAGPRSAGSSTSSRSASSARGGPASKGGASW
jgi:hypothetical protein